MQYICGIDEAGRGPLAGPVTAAAVILPDSFPIEILADSKKLSKTRRETAETVIHDLALAWSVAWVSSGTIDAINIHKAALLAMRRAYYGLPENFRSSSEVVVDGKYVPDVPVPAAAIIRGDSLVHEIMAASILAKCARDRWMVRISERYPEWGFDRHKGYPTRRHRETCQRLPLTPIHRKSFTVSS